MEHENLNTEETVNSDLGAAISCLTRKQKVESLIEGLEWHLGVLKSYKLTTKSCNPQNILNQIEKEETELGQLKQELNCL